ncbi:MAG: glycosyltransferase [Pyrinomonadaceae bacterium]
MAQSEPPLVTVIVACYNQAEYVEECLESVRQQTYRNFEIVIVDDGSDDNSVAVIRRWLDSSAVEATLIVHSGNLGVCRTFNDSIARANGKYISIIAGDDVYLPQKLETQVELFENLPEAVGVVYSDAWQIDKDGKLLADRFIEAHRPSQSTPQGRMFRSLLAGNFIPSMTTLVRRACYQSVGMYDEVLAYEDYDMWLRISREYEFAFSPLISAKYRVVPNSLVRVLAHAGSAKLRSDFRIFEKCLKAKSLSADEREIIRSRLKGLGFEIYARNCRSQRLYLLKLFWLAPGKYALSMLLFCAAGIPVRYFSALLARWKSAAESELAR